MSFFSAANGVGKTATGCNIVANIVFESANPYFDFPIFRDWPYLKRGRIVADPTTIKQKIIPELKFWFPNGKYKTSKGSKDFESIFITDTGWHIDLMTYDQDVKEFESVDLGFFWCDEPPPELIYKALVSRLRRGGIGMITATPLTGSAWMYDALLTKAQPGQRAVTQADVEENCIEHGTRGILKHADIEKMISEYSAEDRQARVFGKFQHLTGLVFKKFSRDIHVIKPFPLKDVEYSVVEFLDQHPRNPDAVLWVATDKMGRKFVVDELYEKFGSTGELAERTKRKGSGYRIVERFADPSAWADIQPSKTMAAGIWKTPGAELEELGLDYQPASKKRTLAIQLIHDALDYQVIEVGGVKQWVKPPILYFFDTCVRAIWEMEHWQYSEWSGKSSEKHDASEKPQDKDDHMIENLGRAFLNDPGFVPVIFIREAPAQAPSNDPYPVSESGGTNLDPY